MNRRKSRELSLLGLSILLAHGTLGNSAGTTGTSIDYSGPSSGFQYQDPEAPIEERVENLIGLMTIEEKIGQLMLTDKLNFFSQEDASKSDGVVEYLVGGLLHGGSHSGIAGNQYEGWREMHDELQAKAMQTRLSIPLIMAIDAVHGNNYVTGSVVFPHNVGLGSTRDPYLLYRIGRVTATEVSATGFDWNFGPCLAAPQNIRWGRTYEGYSENFELVGELGLANIRGLQNVLHRGIQNGIGNPGIIACPKHFVADGFTKHGIDRGNAVLTPGQLEKVLKPYQEAVQAGAQSVMVSYSSLNGTRMHIQKELITGKLKDEWGFDGIVVSDYNATEALPGESVGAQLASVFNAGIDMLMFDSLDSTYLTHDQFHGIITNLINRGALSIERIDDAVKRILRVKFRLGLFENPYVDRSIVDRVRTPEHVAVGREAVRKSLVLLKNEDGSSHPVLPLEKTLDKVLLLGEKADDLTSQCGGWTLFWWGLEGRTIPGTTIHDGIVGMLGPDKVDLITSADRVPADLSMYDAVIAVVGEKPYSEGKGDVHPDMAVTYPPDHHSIEDQLTLALTEEELALVEKAEGKGIPLITLIISGRPLIITDKVDDWDAIVAAWLPGSEAGEGIADVLFGDYDFSGKLPYTWPKAITDIPVQSENPSDAGVLYPYGHGLDYDM